MKKIICGIIFILFLAPLIGKADNITLGQKGDEVFNQFAAEFRHRLLGKTEGEGIVGYSVLITEKKKLKTSTREEETLIYVYINPKGEPFNPFDRVAKKDLILEDKLKQAIRISKKGRTNGGESF